MLPNLSRTLICEGFSRSAFFLMYPMQLSLAAASTLELTASNSRGCRDRSPQADIGARRVFTHCWS